MFICLYLFFWWQTIYQYLLFFPFSRLLYLLFRLQVYTFSMKNRFHNPWIDDTPSTGFSVYPWKKFFDFTNSQKKKEKKKRSHSQTTIVAAQTRDNNSGENSQSIWKRRYSPIPCHCVAFDLSKGLHLFSPLIRGEEEPKILRILHSFLFLFLFFFHEQDESRSKGRIVRASSSI